MHEAVDLGYGGTHAKISESWGLLRNLWIELGFLVSNSSGNGSPGSRGSLRSNRPAFAGGRSNRLRAPRRTGQRDSLRTGRTSRPEDVAWADEDIRSALSNGTRERPMAWRSVLLAALRAVTLLPGCSTGRFIARGNRDQAQAGSNHQHNTSIKLNDKGRVLWHRVKYQRREGGGERRVQLGPSRDCKAPANSSGHNAKENHVRV